MQGTSGKLGETRGNSGKLREPWNIQEGNSGQLEESQDLKESQGNLGQLENLGSVSRNSRNSAPKTLF